MQICIIYLTHEDYACLLEHVPSVSSAYVALNNPTDLSHNPPMLPFSNPIKIECGENDARVILGIAIKHCLYAVPSIEAGIRESQPTHS